MGRRSSSSGSLIIISVVLFTRAFVRSCIEWRHLLLSSSNYFPSSTFTSSSTTNDVWCIYRVFSPPLASLLWMSVLAKSDLLSHRSVAFVPWRHVRSLCARITGRCERRHIRHSASIFELGVTLTLVRSPADPDSEGSRHCVSIISFITILSLAFSCQNLASTIKTCGHLLCFTALD